jgi:hypothetical protein
MSQEVAIIEQQHSLTKFDNFSNLDEMKSFAGELIKSKLIPFKTPEEAVTVALMGKDLGIGFSTAMNNIYNIQGRPALSVHLAAGLAKQRGVDWQIVKDCEKEVDDKGNVIDLITTITFFKFNDKLNRVMENTLSYRWTDAVKAGYTSKANWKDKTRNMMRSRCLMEGIRFICPEALMGLFYEQSEVLDSTTNLEYDIDENDNVTIIRDKEGKIIKTK